MEICGESQNCWKSKILIGKTLKMAHKRNTYKGLSIGNVTKIGVLRLDFSVGFSKHSEQWVRSFDPELGINHWQQICEGKQDHQ